MGCRNCQPIHATRKVEDTFRYLEILACDGRAKTVNFAKRNRRVERVWTHDKDATFTWTPDSVLINGPRGSEVVVEFSIGR